jgi:Na+/melibiose symporter-like transporter
MKLWAGQTISVFGSLIGGTALQFTAILFLQASAFQIGLLAAASLAPGFASGLVAGVWVDRLRRRPLLIIADVGRALLLATIPLAALLDRLTIEQLYVVAFGNSILTVLFDVAYQSYLPSLVGRGDLLEGNSKLSASASVAEVGGFGLAGWLVQLLSGPTTILIDAVSFVVSAVSLSAIRTREARPAPVPHNSSVVREIGEGLRVVLHHPLLRTLAGGAFLLHFCGHGIYGSMVVLYMSRGIGFSPGVLGMTWGVGGISALIGAMLAAPLTRRLGAGRAMVLGLLLGSTTGFLIPLAQGPTLLSLILLILAQLGDGADTVFQINQLSLRQAITPERLLGRVNASMHFVGQGAMLLGALVGGLLGDTIGVRPTLLVGAGGSLLVAVMLALSPLRGVTVDPPEARVVAT